MLRYVMFEFVKEFRKFIGRNSKNGLQNNRANLVKWFASQSSTFQS